MMLIGGMVVMYETKAFWGLEENTNANTLNSTFNTITDLPIILTVVVVGIACMLGLTTKRAF